jgi:hypothetical protein
MAHIPNGLSKGRATRFRYLEAGIHHWQFRVESSHVRWRSPRGQREIHSILGRQISMREIPGSSLSVVGL